MDAFFAKNRLSAYLDGSLPEGEAAEVEQALAEDPALRAEYESLRQAVKLLREVGPVKAPDDLHKRIMARIQVERWRPGGVTQCRASVSPGATSTRRASPARAGRSASGPCQRSPSGPQAST